MAFRVDVTSVAERESKRILEWLIEQQAGESGLRWYEGMQRAVASLESFPARCSLAPESKYFQFEVRQLFYGSTHHRYRILFTVNGDVVTVLHIRHGRRDLLTH